MGIMSGPTARNPLDIFGAVVATFIGNALKDKYRIYFETAASVV
jgi:hypothetical protein